MGRLTHNSQKSEIQGKNQEQRRLDEGFLEITKHKADSMASMEEIRKICENPAGKHDDKILADKFSWVAKVMDKVDRRLSALEESTKKANTKYDTALFDSELGLGPIVENLKKDTADNIQGLSDQLKAEREQRELFEKQVQTNQKEITLMKGIIQKQHKQIQVLQHKVTDVVARGMEENLILSGLYETQGEDLIDRISLFIYDNMNIEARYEDFFWAQRIGQPQPDRIRPIMFQCTEGLRSYILENTGRLKGIGNGNGGFFFITTQQPEGLVADKKNLAYSAKLAKEKNKQLRPEHKSRVEVKNQKLFINGQMFKQKVLTPKPIELFVDDEEQEQMDKLKFFSSDPKTEKGSQFIGAAVQVRSTQDLVRAYRKAMQMNPCADHISMAANLDKTPCFQDDGEFNASAKMHAELMNRKLDNIAIFVIRNYGGRHLGPARFECIIHVTKQALNNIQDNARIDEYKLVQPTSEPEEETENSTD